MKKAVILGGGTAGWLCALLVRQTYPDISLTLIESEDIGILGAGEGTVPDFVQVLGFLKISMEDIILHCDGTLKLGISFNNWNGDDQNYFHEFTESLNGKINSWSVYDKLLADGKSIKPIQLAFQLASKMKTPFVVNEQESLSVENRFALHFNARKLADFLRGIGQSRNIRRAEGRVIEVQNQENGDIRCLTLDNGDVINGDFFFDCTGFARLLVGKHYRTRWNSYQEHLPLDTALPFFLAHDNSNIKPQTDAIAMSSGWMWKIPVKDRYGCGYVFDSHYLSEDQALQEVQSWLGHEVQSPKTFKFQAGCFDDCLVHNCLALGLAQGFIEPLEATSIWATCVNLNSFLVNNLLHTRTDTMCAMYNRRARERNDIIMEFIQLHYITKRADSKFWQEFRVKNKILDSVIQRIEIWNTSGIHPQQSLAGFPPNGATKPDMFEWLSWIQVTQGLGLIDSENFGRFTTPRIDHEIAQTMNRISSIVKHSLDHDFYLQMARGEFNE